MTLSMIGSPLSIEQHSQNNSLNEQEHTLDSNTNELRKGMPKFAIIKIPGNIWKTRIHSKLNSNKWKSSISISKSPLGSTRIIIDIPTELLDELNSTNVQDLEFLRAIVEFRKEQKKNPEIEKTLVVNKKNVFAGNCEYVKPTLNPIKQRDYLLKEAIEQHITKR